ncbi:hypothetical protein IWW50_002525 [Coemansia erecta]|nr:hypothetical protein GGF43_004411 [Coemansia sp. RSA 2618]KAJ2826122.1 hypothetical protein IWW50_002525 [Coemansia erecta]
MSLLARPSFQARLGTLVFQRGMKRKSRIPVTLLKDIPNVGAEGSVVSVHRAYMRHELFPKRLAEYVRKYTGPLDRNKPVEEEEQAVASGAQKSQIHAQKKVHSVALKNQELIGKLMDIDSLVFERNVTAKEEGAEGDAQGIYGSLTKTDVIKQLAEAHGVVVEKEALEMNDKIKHIGEYTCVIKLIYAGQTSIKLCVVPTKSES